MKNYTLNVNDLKGISLICCGLKIFVKKFLQPNLDSINIFLKPKKERDITIICS